MGSGNFGRRAQLSACGGKLRPESPKRAARDVRGSDAGANQTISGSIHVGKP